MNNIVINLHARLHFAIDIYRSRIENNMYNRMKGVFSFSVIFRNILSYFIVVRKLIHFVPYQIPRIINNPFIVVFKGRGKCNFIRKIPFIHTELSENLENVR